MTFKPRKLKLEHNTRPCGLLFVYRVAYYMPVLWNNDNVFLSFVGYFVTVYCTAVTLGRILSAALGCSSLLHVQYVWRGGRVQVIYVYVCMYRNTYSKSMDQPGEVASPARG